jgi:hypothetical protein
MLVPDKYEHCSLKNKGLKMAPEKKIAIYSETSAANFIKCNSFKEKIALNKTA